MPEKEYVIQLQLPAPDKETAKKVADEAQAMIDQFGYDVFLRGVSFMRTHPEMVNVALGMIGGKRR